MDLQEVRNKAREKMKGCHVCPQCNGKACVGMIPGFGGLRTGRSFMRNVEALQEYGLVMRSMSGVDDPDTAVTLMGKRLSMPVLLAPVGGIVLNAQVDGDPAEVEQEYDEAVTQAALDAGTLCFTGDSGAPYMYSSGIASCKKRPGIVIPTIKPRSNDQIIEKAHQAEEADDFAAVHGEFDVGKAADVFAARKRYVAYFKNLFPGLPRFSRQFRRFRADHKARKRVFGFLFGIHG